MRQGPTFTPPTPQASAIFRNFAVCSPRNEPESDAEIKLADFHFITEYLPHIPNRSSGQKADSRSQRPNVILIYRGGLRVPAVISWPGRLPQNEVRDQFAANVDWFPTLASLCGLPAPAHKIDGKNLADVVQSPKATSPHRYFFWQSGGTAQEPQWAVREGDWKLIHNPTGNTLFANDNSASKLYLFNINDDPGEEKNLAESNPRVVRRLQKKYQEWIKEVHP